MQQWKVEYSDEAKRQMRKLDNSVRLTIERFVERLPNYPSPRSLGKSLKGQFSGLWRYKVDDYRLICSIHDNILVIEIVKIGHRSKVYN